MRIDLDRLEQEGGNFSRTYEPGELALDDDEVGLVEPAEVSGRVRRDDKEVELSGELRAKIKTACDRCLQAVNLTIGAELDLNLAVFDGEAIELDDLVREEILLAVPAHVLCREDCKGLCPVCGIDRNQRGCQCEKKANDSRWQGLENLRF